MFTFKLWLISYYKIFNFKHWTNVTPVGPQPRKKLQKTRVRHFSRQFFKTLSQSSQQSSCCHFIWIDENKLNIQIPQNSKVCVFKFRSLFFAVCYDWQDYIAGICPAFLFGILHVDHCEEKRMEIVAWSEKNNIVCTS